MAISVPIPLTNSRMASMVLGLKSLVRMNSVTSSRGIAGDRAALHVVAEGVGGLAGDGDEVLRLVVGDGVV